MTDVSVFDDWAENYNDHVNEEEFPFDGYRQVLDTVASKVMARKSASILDLGIGTGQLARRFYEAGHPVTGVDFSEEMLQIARQSMPKAKLISADFASAMPKEINGRGFDFIVMTYAFHHIPYHQQASFLSKLSGYLNADGQILIGDILFPSQQAMQACQAHYPDEWDEEEYYLIWEDLHPQLEGFQSELIEIPPYAGILCLKPIF
jgi:putative AdoMet-dependent methyltransferase